MLEKLKRFKDAATLYRQITVINPTANVDFGGGSAAFDGHLRRMRGDLDTAAIVLRGSIVLNPNFAYAHGELGQVLQQQGKLQEAATAYRQARSLSKDQSYQAELEQIEALLKDQNNEIQRVEKLIELEKQVAVPRLEVQKIMQRP